MLNPTANRKLSLLLLPSILILVLALLAAACGDDNEGGATPASTKRPSAETAFEIKAVATIQFDKTELTIPANTDVTITMDNTDTGISHNFAVYESREVAESAGPSAAKGLTEICSAPCTDTVTLNLAPGEYFFHCDVHPTQMTGRLIVQ